MNDLCAVTLAPAPTAVPSPSLTASRILAVAEALQPDLVQGFQIAALRLRLEMERAFGGSDAGGAWDWKLAYEAGEVALVLFLRKFGRALLVRAGSPGALLPILAKVSGLLPTHTRRSEEMERFQQFSTPLPMGLAALAAAQITPHDLVLEPSAGTGLLAILAEIAGGSLALNELADTRADLLRLLFPGRAVTRFDAAQINDYLGAGLRPSVILMNPPFSAVANVESRSTEATARHLRSALARLAPGGRLVAITGANFAPDAPGWSETFSRLTESAHLVFTGSVSGGTFAKHGTSFETRISVFDKCRGGEKGGITADLARPMSPDVAHLLARITAEIPPRLELIQAATTRLDPTSPFRGHPARAAKTTVAISRASASASSFGANTPVDAEDLDYILREASEDDSAARLSDAIYETFRLQAIDIPGAAPHPTKLVQSAAMASVAPPKPTYRPKLPAAVLRDGLLSDAQLETVIYAGEAHGAHLAGSWCVDETGDMVSAAPDDAADALRFRRGFFLGDGTGAGKGRQSAGILLDNWCQGRRKALWISKSDKLLEDAQRDWSALGQERLMVTPLSRFAQGRDIPLAEGILFTTYATLRSEERGAKKSRVDQIVDWLGADFDGVILFDESHAMANASGSKGERGDTEASQQGRAGLRLQHKLPNARVVYVSATGATTVHNLAYAQRLGLWGGEDFPFATRAEFVEAIEAGGAVLAQEAATVAFLMPDQASTRYEQHDFPGFKAEMEKLCAECTVIYQNANADVALQQQQFNSVLAQGAKVIVLDPVDSSAAAALVSLAQSQGVKVIAYDRPIPGTPADFYVSFDNKGIGQAIAQSLVDHLKASGVPDGAGVLQINGSPTDAAAGLIRDGIDAALDASPYKTLAEFDTPDWAPPEAQQWAAGQITRFGAEIVGVVAANDGTGGGAVAAFKAAGVDPVPPVTGNDATIAALQLIISGDQYNTISKPSEIVAAAAANIAVAFLKGETPEPKTSLYDTPSELFVPAVVTAENIKAEIFDKGINSAEEVCTGEYVEGCKALGIMQ